MMSEERRHQLEEKTYAVFNAHSINTVAESVGLPPISSDAAAALGEDASYRTRQVVNLATQYMKHSKRRRLCGDDFNKAAKDLNVMPVHGHSSQDPAPFKYIKEAQVHCVEDPEVNLVDIALGDYMPKNIGKPSIKAHWLAVEGVLRVAPNNQGSQGKAGKEMSATHLKYYNCMTKALLSANAEVKKRALQDLKTNSDLVPVLPYLINFVLSGIKNMSHDIEHLTTMLNAFRALIHNRSLYLMHKPYLATIVLGVEFCVLEPLAASINSANDHWVLRDYAARLLAEIVNRWNSPQNHLRFNITKCLKDVLHDTNRPFYCHYGAIMALIALGHKAVEDVIIPHLPAYWPHLKSAMEDYSTENQVVRQDSHKVHAALRLAADKVMRKMMKKFEAEMKAEKEHSETRQLLNMEDDDDDAKTAVTSTDKPPGAQSEGQKALSMYKELEEYFGDSLSACLPLLHTKDFFKPMKKEEIVSLGDQNSGKSGDELLDNLMEQIYLQEKLDQERKARELKRQKEREQLEKERRAKEALERKKREEQERLRKLREEEEQRRKRLEIEEAERQKKLKEEEERRQQEEEEKYHELNRSRTRPQWQQEIELRRQQLEEEMQYSRMMEAKKRREEAKRITFLEKTREETDRSLMDDAEGSRRGLRRRKPVNYTEKDEDISDLIDEKTAKIARTPGPVRPFPFHSDISDDSEDIDDTRKYLAEQSPASSDGMSVSSTMVNASKGSLKLKIKRQSMHSSSPPYPLSGMSQHASPSYQSPSLLSPRHPSPLSVPAATTSPASSYHTKGKSSSGSDKESKHKKSSSGNNGGRHRGASVGSASLLDAWDLEDVLDRSQGSIPPQLYSPGGESSGSDSNPHRKSLKLKLKLTPNHTPE